MVNIDRQDLALMMECGYILVGMQRFKESRAVFEGIAVMAPESEIPIVALGSVAFCEGKFRDAVRHYQKALKLNDGSLFAKAYLGEAHFFLGETDAATRELEAVVSEDAGHKAAIFAKSLLEAIRQGFTPGMLSGVDEFRQYEKEQSHAT